MRFYELKSADDIIRLVQEVGFLPFSTNTIRGFSVEECCPPEQFAAVWGGRGNGRDLLHGVKSAFMGSFSRAKQGLLVWSIFQIS